MRLKNHKNRLWFKLFVSAASLTLTLFALEIGLRLYKGEYGLDNFWIRQRDKLRRTYPTEYSPTLGWVPEPGGQGKEDVWQAQVTILQDGIRSNRPGVTRTEVSADRLILAVGDSFTFGDQVSDDETWPAYLEQMVNVPVLNGGVFGYGVDQAYLRMKVLVEKYKPTVVVFSFIPDDIGRCELAERTSFTKPYFELHDGTLKLRANHIRKRPVRQGNVLQNSLGHSLMFHQVMNHTLPSYWQVGSWRSLKAHQNGEEVVCAIFRELGRFLDANPGIEDLIVFAQYPQNVLPAEFAKVQRVTACVEHDRIRVFDLREPLAEIRTKDPSRFRQLFDRHMTSAGNRFAARMLAAELRKDL